jgi:hypothetical protein
MKFDVIVGNPPYQELTENGNKKPSGNNLWTKFYEESIKTVSNGGYLCYITPPFFSPAYKNIMTDAVSNNTIEFLNIAECGKHFSVGTLFMYYIIKKEIPQDNYKIEYICKYNNKMYFGKIILNKYTKFLPMLISNESISILNKTVWLKHEKINFLKVTNGKLIEKGKYKIRDGNNFRYSNDIHTTKNIKKLVVSKVGYLNPEFDDRSYGLTRNCFYVTVASKKEANCIMSLLDSKLYKFILNICKWNGFNSKLVLENLPYVKFKYKNDEDLYKYFNLSKKEIQLVEETIK